MTTATDITTVKDLRMFLEQNDQSPEEFALLVAVSNMTIRRLLQKPDNTPIPLKYQSLMKDAAEAITGLTQIKSSKHIVQPNELQPIEIIKQGYNKTEDEIMTMISMNIEKSKLNSPENLVDSATKLEATQKNPMLRSKVRKLISILKKPSSINNISRAALIGGLIYFINPFDLIPDAILSLGFVDDVGVLSIILKKITKRS